MDPGPQPADDLPLYGVGRGYREKTRAGVGVGLLGSRRRQLSNSPSEDLESTPAREGQAFEVWRDPLTGAVHRPHETGPALRAFEANEVEFFDWETYEAEARPHPRIPGRGWRTMFSGCQGPFEAWIENGLLYNPAGPAFIASGAGNDLCVHYAQAPGILGRVDGPALEIGPSHERKTRVNLRSGSTDKGDQYIWLRGEGVAWVLDGLIHRAGGPAIEMKDGTKLYARKGLRHRSDGPALTKRDGSTYWYSDGILGRPASEGPAITLPSGTSWQSRGGKVVEGPADVYVTNGKIRRVEQLGAPDLTPADPSEPIWRSWKRAYYPSPGSTSATGMRPSDEAHLWFARDSDFAGAVTAHAACGRQSLSFDHAGHLSSRNAPACAECQAWFESKDVSQLEAMGTSLVRIVRSRLG